MLRLEIVTPTYGGSTRARSKLATLAKFQLAERTSTLSIPEKDASCVLLEISLMPQSSIYSAMGPISGMPGPVDQLQAYVKMVTEQTEFSAFWREHSIH
jgi:hypothetical protein